MKFHWNVKSSLKYGVATLCVIAAIVQHRRYLAIKENMQQLLKEKNSLKILLDQAYSNLEKVQKQSIHQDKLSQELRQKSEELEMFKVKYQEAENKIQVVQLQKSKIEQELDKMKEKLDGQYLSYKAGKEGLRQVEFLQIAKENLSEDSEELKEDEIGVFNESCNSLDLNTISDDDCDTHEMIVITKSETSAVVGSEIPLTKSQNHFGFQTFKPKQPILKNQLNDGISDNFEAEPDYRDNLIVSLELRVKELQTQHLNKIKELNKDYESDLNTLIIQNQRLKSNLANSEQHNEELGQQVQNLNEKLNSFEKDSEKTLAKSFTTFDDYDYQKSHTKSDISNFSFRTESLTKKKDNKLQDFHRHQASTKVENKKNVSNSPTLGGIFTSISNVKLLNSSNSKADKSFHHNQSAFKSINEPIFESPKHSDTFSGSKLVSDKSDSKPITMETLFIKSNKNLQDNAHFIRGLTENLTMSADKSVSKSNDLLPKPTLGHSVGHIMKRSTGYMPLAYYFGNYISNELKK